MVERMDNIIYIEEASKFTLTMAIEYSKPKLKHDAKHTHVHRIFGLDEGKSNALLLEMSKEWPRHEGLS